MESFFVPLVVVAALIALALVWWSWPGEPIKRPSYWSLSPEDRQTYEQLYTREYLTELFDFEETEQQ